MNSVGIGREQFVRECAGGVHDVNGDGLFVQPWSTEDHEVAQAVLRSLVEEHEIKTGASAGDRPSYHLSRLRKITHFDKIARAVMNGEVKVTEALDDDEVRIVLGSRAGEAGVINESMQRDYPSIVTRLLEGVDAGAAKDYISHAMKVRTQETFRMTAIQVVDPVMLPAVPALYLPDSNRVVIAADLGVFVQLPTLIGHEVAPGHAVSGGTFGRDDKGRAVRRRVGFHELGKKEYHSGLDEGIGHHLALGALDEGHDFETIDPAERMRRGSCEDGVYTYYRTLIAEFVKRSTPVGLKTPVIDFKNITRAYGEDSDDKGKETTYRRRMVEEGAIAYGPGAYRHLDTLMRAAAKIPLDDPNWQELLQPLIDRIHSPVVSAQGKIIPGLIDVEGLQV